MRACGYNILTTASFGSFIISRRRKEIMEANWKRAKVLEGVTTHITTPQGTLHLTFNYDGYSLVEVIAHLGKAGTYAAKQLDMICRMLSIVLQSPLSRVKIVKKIKKSLFDMNMEMPFEWEGKNYEGVEDYIFKAVVHEIETKELKEEMSTT
jgi:hypothetical protein